MNMRRISRRRVLGSVGAASLGSALQARARVDADPSSFGSPRIPELAPAFTFEAQLGAASTEALAAVPHAVTPGGQVRGKWQGHIVSGVVEYPGGAQRAGLRARLVVRQGNGELLDLRIRAVPAETGPATAQMILHCELIPAASDGTALPVVLVGRLDADALAVGTLRSVVFEVS